MKDKIEGVASLVHVVVMGCGRVGTSLVAALEQAGHDVTIIDQNADAFRRLGDNFAGRKVVGVGFDRETLEAAGIETADAFAAVSSGDNSNIIAARVARETFGVGRVIARIYDPKRAEVYERLGIPTIATVPWTSSRLLKAILGETASEIWRDPSGVVAMLRVSPHEGWVGHLLSELESVSGARVALLTRFGSGQLPTPSTLIQAGDLLDMLVTDEFAQGLGAIAANPPEGATS